MLLLLAIVGAILAIPVTVDGFKNKEGSLISETQTEVSAHLKTLTSSLTVAVREATLARVLELLWSTVVMFISSFFK